MVSLAKTQSDPQASARSRRAMDRLRKSAYVVTGTGVYLDDEGKIALRLPAGGSFTQDEDGLKLSDPLVLDTVTITTATITSMTYGSTPGALMADVDGLVTATLSPELTGLTLTGFDGFLFATNGLVSVRETVGTTLASSVVDNGNAGNIDDPILVHTVPGGTLSGIGDSLEFYGTCETTNAGVAVTVKVSFDGVTLLTSGSLTGLTAWFARGTIQRVSATSVRCQVTLTTSIAGSTFYQQYTAAAVTLANDSIWRVSAFSSTSNVVFGRQFKIIYQPG